MAGDWIKMRGALLTNPKVVRMGRHLASNKYFREWWTRGTNASCDETVYELCDVTVVTRVTVASLLSVWSAVNDAASKGGFIKGIGLFEVDEMAGVPGFGESMQLVGWLIERENGIEFPNFEEHNTIGKDRSSSAKTGAERTKEWRQKKRASDSVTSDVTVTSQSDHREEKRREEQIPPIPRKRGKAVEVVPASDLVVAGFSTQVAEEFLAHKERVKAPLTPRAWQLHLSEAGKAGWTPQRAAEHVMAKNWKGFEASYVANARDSVTSQSDAFAGAR